MPFRLVQYRETRALLSLRGALSPRTGSTCVFVFVTVGLTGAADPFSRRTSSFSDVVHFLGCCSCPGHPRPGHCCVTDRLTWLEARVGGLT